MSDLMIDLETLGTSPDAVILTIGAQGFDPFSDRFTDVTFYKRVTVESQPNRKVDEGTLEWWSKQSVDAQEEAMGDGPDRVPLKQALEELSKIAFQHKRIWANGICFDITMLENAMVENEVSCPWKFWQVCDARTVYKLGKAGTASGTGNTHNALEDCVNQIDMLQKVIAKFGVTEF